VEGRHDATIARSRQVCLCKYGKQIVGIYVEWLDDKMVFVDQGRRTQCTTSFKPDRGTDTRSYHSPWGQDMSAKLFDVLGCDPASGIRQIAFVPGAVEIRDLEEGHVSFAPVLHSLRVILAVPNGCHISDLLGAGVGVLDAINVRRGNPCGGVGQIRQGRS